MIQHVKPAAIVMSYDVLAICLTKIQVSDNYLLTSRQPACVWDPAKDVQLHVVSSPDVS